MNLSLAAWRHRTVVLLATALAMVFGLASYFTLPAREDPEITIREAVITTRHPGLAAERVETLITRPLEQAVRVIPELQEIRSTSMRGTSIIHVEAEDHFFELEQILDEVREAVLGVAPRLPPGTTTPRVDDEFGDVAVLTIALTAPDGDYSDAELRDHAEWLRDRLYAVPGTHRVDVLGVQPDRVYVQFDPAALAAVGVSPRRVADALRARNVLTSGGAIDTGRDVLAVTLGRDFDAAADVAATLVHLPDGTRVPVRDLADVRREGARPSPRRARLNGERALVLAVSMSPGVRVLDYSPRVRAALEEARTMLPPGLAVTVATEQAEQVANAVFGVSLSVLQTLAIVLAVVIAFLGLRTGFVVGSMVPAVMLVVLALMNATGLALERMSLATLVIALGLLVDNGIVVAEDFRRRLEDGLDRQAAIGAVGRELAWPLAASSATTVLFFLPLMLAEHSSGEYTRAISLVVLFSLAVSWLLAMTVTPILCHRFVPDPVPESERRGGAFVRLESGYARALRGLLRHRFLFLIVLVAIFAASLVSLREVPQKFFPDSDRAQILVYADLPAGASADATDARLQEIAAIAGDAERFPKFGDMAAYVGFGGPRFVLSLTPVDPAPHRGFLVVNTTDLAAVEGGIPRLRAALDRALPDVETRVSRMFLGPEDPNVIQLQVKGPDADYIVDVADQIAAVLASVPGTIDIWSDWYEPTLHLDVAVDRERAALADVRAADIADALRAQTDGFTATVMREDDEPVSVVLRADDGTRRAPDRLADLPVPREDGTAVPLSRVAEIVPRFDHGFRQRENLTRTVTVEARNVRLSPEDMAPLVEERFRAIGAALRPGHAVEYDGILTESAEGRAALRENAPLCLAAAVLLLVWQFGSLLRPLIIVLSIPFILVGAVAALWLTGEPFGFMIILGLYSLAGIRFNDAIVLVDRIDIERREGNAGAVVDAAVRRLRPIVMTTVTTVLGLMPLILSKDVLFYGMASVIALGVAFGTVITLGIVPVLYDLLIVRRRPPQAVASAA